LELLEKRRKDEAMSADLYVEMSKFVDSMEEVFLAKILEERRRDDGDGAKGGTWWVFMEVHQVRNRHIMKTYDII